jgi:hypothetical protein
VLWNPPRLRDLSEEFSATKQHLLPGDPVASATAARLALGSSLVGGSGSGTFFGINAGSGFAGRFAEYQQNNISKLRINRSGSVAIGSRSAGFTNTTFSVDVDSDGPTNEFLLKMFDITLPTNNATFKGLYFGLGQGTNIATGWAEIGMLDEGTGTIRMMNFQRTGALTGQTMFWGDWLMAQNNKALQFTRTDSVPIQVFRLDASDNLITSLAYTGATSMSMRWVVDSPTSTWKWMHTFDTVEVMELTAGGVLTRTTRDAATNALTTVSTLRHNTSGAVANGFGSQILFQFEDSTDEDQDAGAVSLEWADKTHASRSGRGRLWANYTTTAREVMRWEANATGPLWSLFGVAAQGQQTVNAAAVDPATTMALCNQLRATLVGFGLCV